MKRHCRVLACLVLGLFIGCNKGTPVAMFSELSYEGIPQDGILQYRFEVRNEGTEVLELQEITPNCGCTLVSVGERSILPGSSSFIEAKMEPSPLRRSSFISVVTNDPKRPEIILELKAVGLYPNEFSFLPSSRRIAIRRGDQAVVRVLLRFIARKENGPLESALGEPQFTFESEGLMVDFELDHKHGKLEEYGFAHTLARWEDGWMRIEYSDRTVWLRPVTVKIVSNEPGPKFATISAKLKGNHAPDPAFMILGVDVQ